MGALGAIALQAVWAMVGRLVTAKGTEWVLRWAARRLVSMTQTPHDDIFLDGIEKLLDNPEGK